ncbi:MAG: ATP-binding protein [Chloroflexia bacterium]
MPEKNTGDAVVGDEDTSGKVAAVLGELMKGDPTLTGTSSKGTDEHPYKMAISLNVLNHLGIGLYSNVPAVLSEAVANSWDADATLVTIEIDPDKDEIVISDNGVGMTHDDINNKYLLVGYQKRKSEPGLTAMGRAPMGRKGIGKLSVFSIANVVEVYSVKDGERSGLRMKAEDIERHMEENAEHPYWPEPINEPEVPIDMGTRIVLKELKKDLTRTGDYLRRRLARRFSILGSKHNFEVRINNEPISARDRDYYEAIEFLWYFGAQSADIVSQCPNVQRHFVLDGTVDGTQKYKVTGWIATVDERKNIDESNNTIVIFAHGKLIQEDILKDLPEGGVYSKYLIGEIDADFMDLNDKDDVVTSDRQRVKEDDSRYKLIKSFVWSVLKKIQNEWTELRNDIGAQRALEEPAVKNWYDALQGDHKKWARLLFGKIESLRISDKTAKRELYKASILAFQKLAMNNALGALAQLNTQTDFNVLTSVFQGIDDLEAVYYYQIVKARVGVLKEFEGLVVGAQERVIQKYLFEHLWLLHPSWERASTDQTIEKAVQSEWKKLDAKITEEEKKGRIDIRYRTAAGKHIIVELKKYDRKVKVTDLVEQVTKYQDALRKVLRTRFPEEADRPIESIILLGSPPLPVEYEDRNNGILREVSARYITYDSLIRQTVESYRDYLDKEKAISKLVATLEEFDTAF